MWVHFATLNRQLCSPGIAHRAAKLTQGQRACFCWHLHPAAGQETLHAVCGNAEQAGTWQVELRPAAPTWDVLHVLGEAGGQEPVRSRPLVLQHAAHVRLAACSQTAQSGPGQAASGSCALCVAGGCSRVVLHAPAWPPADNECTQCLRGRRGPASGTRGSGRFLTAVHGRALPRQHAACLQAAEQCGSVHAPGCTGKGPACGWALLVHGAAHVCMAACSRSSRARSSCTRLLQWAAAAAALQQPGPCTVEPCPACPAAGGHAQPDAPAAPSHMQVAFSPCKPRCQQHSSNTAGTAADSFSCDGNRPGLAATSRVSSRTVQAGGGCRLSVAGLSRQV